MNHLLNIGIGLVIVALLFVSVLFLWPIVAIAVVTLAWIVGWVFREAWGDYHR